MITAAQYSVHTGNLILVNQDYPYRENTAPRTLVPVDEETGEVLMDRRAAVLLKKLISELHGRSQITAVSGWRPEQEQREIYSRSLLVNGPEFTGRFVAKPGHSEHQTGLAIDLGLKQPNIDFIRPDFPPHGICRAFRERAAIFGFIERYPAGKEKITGIAHEPWHFRYVGSPHAEIMTEMGFTLEEYHDFLKQFPYGGKLLTWHNGRFDFTVSYMKAINGADTLHEIKSGFSYPVSGDNENGFIITERRDKNG